MTAAHRAIDWILFDVNETLTDLSTVEEWMSAHGFPAGSVSAWLAAVLRDGFAASLVAHPVRFAQLGSAALRELARRRPASPPLGEDGEREFWSTVREADAHVDVAPGLRSLRGAGYRLATLSNGATAIAEAMLERAGASTLVERTLSVDATPTWKPHAAAYRGALAELGAQPHRSALVACHPWDILGAHSAGLRTVWIPRGREDWPSAYPAPDHVVGDAMRIADALAELG